jgi:hypothetical protein
MDRRGQLALTLLALLVVSAATLAACSSDAPQPTPSPTWQQVSSGSFSGAKTERLDLGSLYLAGEVRIAWDLSGPSDARSQFTLSVTHEFAGGSSTGGLSEVRSWTPGFALRSDDALGMRPVPPNYYDVSLTQLLRSASGLGYSGTFALFTQDVD